MSLPHTCRCATCGREMSPMFVGMDVAKGPDVTAFWCTKHGPIETITTDGCPKCKAEQSAQNGKGDA